MKNLLFLFAILLNNSIYSQDSKLDTVIKIKGDALAVKIININEYEITYSFPNEQLTYSVSKNVIREIRFGSGRREAITSPEEIKGEEDWEKVILTSVPSNIKGLTLVKDIDGFGKHRDPRIADVRAMEQIKREAAILGAHIVLIESKVVNSNVLVITGKAYKY
jgi:hypothetical protein